MILVLAIAALVLVFAAHRPHAPCDSPICRGDRQNLYQ